MGSMITLGIDRFEVDWSKNHLGSDHSILFHGSDIHKIPYYYADGVIEIKDGMSRTLRSVKNRLDLLGYSQYTLPIKYKEAVEQIPFYYPDVSFTFEQFKSVLTSINLALVEHNAEAGDYDLGEYVSQCIFNDPEFKHCLPSNLKVDNDLGTFFENLDPYITLRLLAENENNLDRLVQWRYADVVDGGYVEQEDVWHPLSGSNKILVVTEGSSDSFIIRRAIDSLCSDIADFFDFVDMHEHYPFTGTGSLYRFCQGLSKIRIQNNVLVIFDNDTAGVEAYEHARLLERPANMVICKLPEHEYFREFNTVGPTGSAIADINGSAVAIECFLDVGSKNDACVRWTSYNSKLKQYQGELEDKDLLVRKFKNANLTDGTYDASRLVYLLNHLVDQWIQNATRP